MSKMALKMQCVECGALMLLGDAACPNGHQYSAKSDVHRYLKADFANDFDKWLECLQDYRTKMMQPVSDSMDYDALPHITAPEQKRLWKLRVYELDFIRKTLGKQTGLKVLEVGAWIGWLSNRLTQDGQHVVGIDYFASATDGLAAKQHYSNPDWLTIQLDTEFPTIIQEQFDVVIFNHNLPYFIDIEQTITTYKKLLKPGGTFFIIGLQIIKDTTEIEHSFTEHREKFKAAYGIDMLFKPMKSCIDLTDKKMLIDNGFELVKEPRMRLNNLKNKLDPKKPQYYHAIFKG